VFKLALRGVKLNAGRYIATIVAIMTGVAFFAAAGFLGDRVTSALEGNARDQYAGVDAAITIDPDANDDFGENLKISADVVSQMAALPEVAAIAGHLTGSVSFLADDGTTFADGATGRLWIEDEELNPTDLVEGSAPSASGEVTVDRGTADDENLTVGQSVTVLTLAGQKPATIVGITEFGDNDAEDDGGTVSISSADAFEWLNSGLAEYEDAYVRTDGSQDDLVAALQPLVPPGFKVQSGADFIQEQVDAAGSIGKILKQALQVFALLALFVGGFVIVNTFTVIVAQRLRELAVLAAIGATPKQLKRSLRWEGLLIGLIGSVLGVVVGFALTYALVAVLSATGVDLPGSGLRVTPNVVTQGIILGTLITFFSVMRPARKAARTEPIEALRQSAVENDSLTRNRIIASAILVGGGAVGLVAAPSGAILGPAALAFFVGMIVAGPVIALGGSKVFRPVMSKFGLEGRLAADNIGRNPQRTATTSNALLIGVFLVSLVTVSGNSVKDFAVSKIDELSSADFNISSNGGTIDDQLVADLEAIPDVTRVVPFRTESVAQQNGTGTPVTLSTGDLAELADVANVRLDAGAQITEVGDLQDGQVLVIGFATDKPAVGDTVTYQSAQGSTVELTVAGVIKSSLDSLRLGNLTTPTSFDGFVGETAPTEAFIDTEDAVQSDVQDEIEKITDLRPDIALTAGNQLSQVIGQIFDFMINAVNGLLLMSVVVALIGIVNTMSLSIIERRRELGLLRIVGMVDRRVRRMVRLESIMIATLGTVTGLVMGMFMGFSLVFAIDRLSGANISVNFAPTQLAVVLVAGVLLGFLAALIPAHRSTKPEVLDAIQVT
jgi:putative ABC transport system permease protein